jgi:hypothetical protein
MQKIKIDTSELSNIEYYLRVAFALSYSVMTVLILGAYPKLTVIILAAIFDGISVFLNYNIYLPNFLQIAAIYFGLYTAFVSLIAGIIARSELKKRRQKNEPNEPKNEINELQRRKISLQNSLNRLKCPIKREHKQKELNEITQKIGK